MRFIAVVNEPGEFNELLKLARLLRTKRNAQAMFIFIRPDYAAIKRHSEVCTREKIPYIHTDGNFSVKSIPLALTESTYNDYIPTYHITPDLIKKIRDWLRARSKSKELRNEFRTSENARWFLRLGTVAAGLIRFLQLGRSEGLVLHLARFRQTLRRIGEIRRFASAVLDWTDADIVLLGQDFAASENTVMAHVARRRGIPVAILPFAMGTTKEINESLLSSAAHQHHDDLFSREFEKRAPHWINIYRGRALVRAPVGVATAYLLSDMDTPLPWLPQSGLATLLTPSQQAYDYYAQAGIEGDLLQLTGSLNDQLWRNHDAVGDKGGNERDIAWFERMVEINRRQNAATESVRGTLGSALMAEGERQSDLLRGLKFFFGNRFEPESFDIRMGALNRHLKYEDAAQAKDVLPCQSGSPLIVVSWVTNQYGREGPPLELPDYESLSRAWASSLKAVARDLGATVVVSLHPTLEFSSLHYLEDEFGFLVWRGQLSDILDRAHVFVACVSSTLIWANNLMIPALNYDCYRYGYREFEEAGAIVTIETHHNFEIELRRLISDIAYRQHLIARAEARRGYWGFFDGKSEDRILDAIDDLIAKQSHNGKGSKRFMAATLP